jgi:hypothetical protein
VPPGEERAGVDGIPGRLFDGKRLAGEQRLVDHQRGRVEKARVGGHPIALAEQDDVAPHHLGAGDAEPFAVAHDESPGAREVPESLQRALRPVLLGDGDRQDHEDRGGQDERLPDVAQHHIHRRRRQQQDEHRLAEHVEHERGAAARCRWQRVGAVDREPLGGLGGRQSNHGSDIRPRSLDGHAAPRSNRSARQPQRLGPAGAAVVASPPRAPPRVVLGDTPAPCSNAPGVLDQPGCSVVRGHGAVASAIS